MSSTTARPARRSYGGWTPIRSPGIGGSGLLGLGIILLGLLVTMFAVLAGGLEGGLGSAVFFTLAFVTFGTGVGRWVGQRVAFRSQVSRREHQWRSGVFSRNRDYSLRLPGMLGRTTLIDATDTFGVPFGVVRWPGRGGYYTVVARCSADGPALQDQDRIDVWVANWAGVLSSTGRERALVCAKAITETAPDPGGRLASLVHASKADTSPDLATAVMDECVATYPAASSENTTYVEMTFHGRTMNKRNDQAAIVSEIGRKVPSILAQVEAAGGGSVDMVTAQEWPRIVRAAYDPAAAPWLEAAELDGSLSEETDVMEAWREAGPVAEQAAWDHFVHDSGVSVTWEMVQPPRSTITEMAASNLLRPHRDFVRKRVALIYRPHSAEESTAISESDMRTATWSAKTGQKQITAVAQAAVQATEQSRQEVAYGASLVRLSVLVTATVRSMDDLDQAVATIESQAGMIPLKMRRSYGCQSSAFAATLPVGFVPWEHTVIPTNVREHM